MLPSINIWARGRREHRRAAPCSRDGAVQDDSVKSAEYCWARAEDSELMAVKAKDPQNKAIFYDLATRWRRLAEESKGDALMPIGGKPRMPV